MRKYQPRSGLWLLACAAACGCAPPDVQDFPYAGDRDRVRFAHTVAGDGAALPKFVVDEEGREWSVRRVDRWSRFPIGVPSANDEVGPPYKPTAADLSDSELAERWAMVKLVGDLEYRELRPDVEAIRDAIARNAAGQRLRADPNEPSSFSDPATGSPVAPIRSQRGASGAALADTRELFSASRRRARGANRLAAAAPKASSSGPSADLVFGNDDRFWVSNAYQWPHGAMLKIADTSQIGTASTFWLPEYFSGRASGTLIGRYTAVVAAHSFYSRNDHDWYPLANWAVDVVKRRNDNTLLEERTAVYPPTYFCYALTIPSGYMMYGGTEWDFGVFEATCDTNPGSYTGWLPAGVGSDYDLVSSSSYIEGYDAAVDIKGNPLPPQNVGSYHYFYGSLLTRFAGPSAAWPDPYYSYVIDTVMDVSPGASGSGIVKNLFLANYGDPTYYWSGVVRREGLGDPADGDYQYNIVRRHDWPMWWFISGATTEW